MMIRCAERKPVSRCAESSSLWARAAAYTYCSRFCACVRARVRARAAVHTHYTHSVCVRARRCIHTVYVCARACACVRATALSPQRARQSGRSGCAMSAMAISKPLDILKLGSMLWIFSGCASKGRSPSHAQLGTVTI